MTIRMILELHVDGAHAGAAAFGGDDDDARHGARSVDICVKDVIYIIIIALLGLLHCVLKDLYLKEINNERGEEK